jgi:hypothetical protein
VEDELEAEEEDEEDHVDGESTDSMVSAAVFAASTPRPDAVAAAAASPFLVKRTSNASGAIYYQARAVNPAAGEEQASKVKGGHEILPMFNFVFMEIVKFSFV